MTGLAYLRDDSLDRNRSESAISHYHSAEDHEGRREGVDVSEIEEKISTDFGNRSPPVNLSTRSPGLKPYLLQSPIKYLPAPPLPTPSSIPKIQTQELNSIRQQYRDDFYVDKHPQITGSGSAMENNVHWRKNHASLSSPVEDWKSYLPEDINLEEENYGWTKKLIVTVLALILIVIGAIIGIAGGIIQSGSNTTTTISPVERTLTVLATSNGLTYNSIILSTISSTTLPSLPAASATFTSLETRSASFLSQPIILPSPTLVSTIPRLTQNSVFTTQSQPQPPPLITSQPPRSTPTSAPVQAKTVCTVSAIELFGFDLPATGVRTTLAVGEPLPSNARCTVLGGGFLNKREVKFK